MPSEKKRVRPRLQPDGDELREVLASLQRLSSKRTRDEMARYGLPSDKALGVPIGKLQQLARQIGRKHELAERLWQTDIYEARLLASFVDDPAQVTAAQMDRWCRDFDNWGICDTVCFNLFDRTPHAWRKIEQWSRRRDEFQKRGAFALLACVALHRKDTADTPFLKLLPLIERAADDDRNFVRKGVSWALRSIGGRNLALHAAALGLARRLADSTPAAARWIGRDALRDLQRPVTLRRLAARKHAA